MLIPRLRSVAVLAVVAVTAIMLGACGGGGDDGGDDASFEGETVTSSDGVLTVQVPEGAAAEGVEVTVTPIEAGDLPSELRAADADGVVIVGYELGPDGAEFAEPLAVTFRVDPGEVGLELPEGAVPLGALLTENATGELEGLAGAELSRDGDLLVAQATVTHFSPAVLVLSETLAVKLTPPRVELDRGQMGTLVLSAEHPQTAEPVDLDIRADLTEIRWTATPPFTVVNNSPALSGSISCTARTDGWVEDAYQVLIPGEKTVWDLKAQIFLGGLDLFGLNSEPLGIRLASDGKCNAPEETATPEASSTSAGGAATAAGAASVTPTPTPGQDQVTVSGRDGSTEVGTDNCYDEDGWLAEGECPLNIDIVRVDWRSDGDFLELVVGFGEPVSGDQDISVNVTIHRNEGKALTTVVDVSGGAATCRYPGSDGPLAGESCGVTENGEIVVRRDTSDLTLTGDRGRLSIKATVTSDDGWLKDAAQIWGIPPR